MRILLLLMLTCCLAEINAQQGFEGGLFMGIANYQGDLVDSYVELKETNLAMGASAGYVFSNNFVARLAFRKGRISGNDANSKDALRRERALKFKSDLYELALLGEWYILGRDRFMYTKGANWFNPYLFMGIAMVHSKSYAEGEGLPEKVDNSSLFVSIPIGGGLKFSIYDYISLGLEGGFRPAFSDYLDGVSQLGNPNGNDWYLFAGVNIAFLLTRHY